MDTAQKSNTQKTQRINSIPGDPMCGKILFLKDWVEKNEDSGRCISCDLSVIGPWYRDLLRKKGYTELADKIDRFADEEVADVYKFAELLDEIRENIKDEDTRRELLTYDCMMQKYDQEEK